MTTTCPQCGTPNSENATDCIRCGIQLRCPHCGLPIDHSPIVSPIAGYCSGCGTPVVRLPKSGKPWYVAMFKVLALIALGGVGFLCALGGSCVLIIGVASAGTTSFSYLPVGLGIMGIAAACVYAMVKLIQKM